MSDWDYRYRGRNVPPRREWWAPLLSGKKRVIWIAMRHYTDSYIKPLLLWRKRARNHH